MANQYINQVGYGLTTALPVLAPYPIQAKRAPTTADTGYPVGQIWVYLSSNAAYILTSVVNNSANWQLLQASGGSGVFANLTVNPGPINLTGVLTQVGTANINVSGTANTNIGSGTNTGAVQIGSANASSVSILSPLTSVDATAAGTVSVGPSITTGSILAGIGLTTGVITLGNAAMTGALTVGNSTSGQTINIGAAANAGAQVVNIASGASGANSTVNILTGAGTAGTQTFNVLATGATRAGVVNIGTGAAAHIVTVGSLSGAAQTTIQGGTAGVEVEAPFLSLFNGGPVYIYTGAGAPSNGLALHTGDLYINTSAASTTTRLYIATGAGAWTYFTSNA
jgi:hypothetical protein